ncbi:hypothetical protein B0H13DRAFT_2417771 [Mycena leptocephala]|nr:hypothetical protein B0H13DRAFT_2417771 [Mycena leptocephala]
MDDSLGSRGSRYSLVSNSNSLECLVILAAVVNGMASSLRLCVVISLSIQGQRPYDIPDNTECNSTPRRPFSPPTAGSICSTSTALCPPTVAWELTYNGHSIDNSGVCALGFRALLDFSGVIVTAWHAVRRPPSPSLPPSRPRCPSLPPGVRIHKQHIHPAPIASGQRCKPVPSNTCSSCRAREAAPPRLPRRPTTTATTPSALLAMLTFLYGASLRASRAVETEIERHAQMGRGEAGDLDVCVCSCILASTKLELGMGVEKARVHRALALGESRIGDGGADGDEDADGGEGMPLRTDADADGACAIAIRTISDYRRCLPRASLLHAFGQAVNRCDCYLCSYRVRLCVNMARLPNSSRSRSGNQGFDGSCFHRCKHPGFDSERSRHIVATLGEHYLFQSNLISPIFLALYQVGRVAWRFQLGSAFLPAVPLMFGVYPRPTSNPPMAYEEGTLPGRLRVLRNTQLQAACDLYYIHRQLTEEFAVLRGANYFTRFFELFTIPRVGRALLAAFIVMIAQQMCGMDDTR